MMGIRTIGSFGSWRARTCKAMGRTNLIAALAICALVGMTTAAQAASVTPAPGWEVTPMSYPTNLKPGTQGYVVLAIQNVGGATSNGTFTVTDQLPEGVTATEANYGEAIVEQGTVLLWNCSVGGVVTCTNKENTLPSMRPGEIKFLLIAVKISPSASGTAPNKVTVSGGGALSPASATGTLHFEANPPGFGFQDVDGWFSSGDGTLDTQAGSHPYALSTVLALNNTGNASAGELRNVTVKLPYGLIGNPTAAPRCTAVQLNEEACPSASQVGEDTVLIHGVELLSYPESERPGISEVGNLFPLVFPVYNMVPPPGVPAQLGFTVQGVSTRINAGIRSGGDYGITAKINNIAQRQITFNSLTVWGEPADPSHDWQREGRAGVTESSESGQKANIGRVPFLTMPTSCEGPLLTTASTEEWAEEGIAAPPSEASFTSHENSGLQAGITGCDHLSFDPKMTVAPDTADAETPAGLTVELKTPRRASRRSKGSPPRTSRTRRSRCPKGWRSTPGRPMASPPALRPSRPSAPKANRPAPWPRRSAPTKSKRRSCFTRSKAPSTCSTQTRRT